MEKKLTIAERVERAKKSKSKCIVKEVNEINMRLMAEAAIDLYYSKF